MYEHRRTKTCGRSAVYRERFERRGADGVGRGAKWEGAIVTQDLFERELHNVKYVPILFEAADRAHVPNVLRGTTHYDLGAEDGYEQLYRRLTDQPEVPRAKMGTLRSLPALDVRWQDPDRVPSTPPATISFRDDLHPDEVGVYERVPAIVRGEPVAIRWPSLSEELYELLVARRPDLRRQLLERGHVPGEQLVRAMRQFDEMLAAASRLRDGAAGRIPLMWEGMRESGWWGRAAQERFRRALQNYLVLVNAHVLLSLGSIQFEDDHRPLPDGVCIGMTDHELVQLPEIAEALGAQPPFWAADAGEFYVYGPRHLCSEAYRKGVGRAARFFGDFVVPQREELLIGSEARVSYDPVHVIVYKLRDETFEELDGSRW